jgi:hypothetical protein
MAEGKLEKPKRGVIGPGQIQLHSATSSTDASYHDSFTITAPNDGMISAFLKPIAGIANEPVARLKQGNTLLCDIGGVKNTFVGMTLFAPIVKGYTYTVEVFRCNLNPGIYFEPFA